MRISLIHCYSDNNKGDLAIILGTINILREVYPGCKINAISTFEEHDPLFKTDHAVLKRYVDELYPAIVGRLLSNDGSTRSLFLKLLSDLPKLITIYTGLFDWMKSIVFSASDKKVCSVIESSDIVISKGGSYLCSTPGMVGFIRFIRILAVLVISCKLNSKTVIWGQSLGPLYNKFESLILNSTLKKLFKVILRESECLRLYPYIKPPRMSTVFGNDLAFNVNVPLVDVEKVLPSGVEYIGITIKRMTYVEVDQNYSIVMKGIIEYLLDKYKFHIVLLPQVTIGNDVEKSIEIRSAISDKYKDRITLFSGSYELEMLISMYKKLRLLIGTRLHSVILALNVGTPVINIAYHGTKSQGVFKCIGLQQYVLNAESLSIDNLTLLIDRVLIDGNGSEIFTNLEKIRSQNRKIGSSLLVNGGNTS